MVHWQTWFLKQVLLLGLSPNMTESAQQAAIDLGAIEILLDVILNSTDEARIMASRALSNLLDLGSSLPHFTKNNGLQALEETTKIFPDVEHDFVDILHKLLQDPGSRVHVGQTHALPFLTELFCQHLENEDEAQEVIGALISASEFGSKWASSFF